MPDVEGFSLEKWLNNVRSEYWEHLGHAEIEDKVSGVEYVVFNVMGVRFGIDARCCKGVVKKPRITKLPGMPSYILGVTSISGEIISVSDPAELMGMPGERDKSQGYLLIIASEAVKTALWVDKVSDVAMFPDDELAPFDAPWAGAQEGVVVGQWAEAEDAVLIIDCCGYIEASAIDAEAENE